MTYGYSAPSELEGTPIVCRNCGGGMRLQPDMTAHCAYCGARDQLPADEASRYLELKNRLSFARSRAAQVQGMDAALARVFEDKGAFLRVGGVYLGVAIAVTLTSAVSFLRTDLSKAPENLRMSVYMHELFAPGIMLGVVASLGLGLLGGRSQFRRRVRPLLLARPIQGASHAAFGCRVCGAELAEATDASVTCRYCQSVNLVPASQHDAHVALANQRAASLQQNANRASGNMVSLAARMRFIVIAGVAFTFAVVYFVPALLDHYVFKAY